VQQFIHTEIEKLQHVLMQLRQNHLLLQTIEQMAVKCIHALQMGKKILLAGNGGSAADSQHLAAELVSRLRYSRPGLAAIALTTDTSVLTAIGNDDGFDQIFARQLEAIGAPGDVFIGISTSGKSPNIVEAFRMARHKGIATIGLTGENAPLLLDYCDNIVNIPSQETPKIQECHILLGHILCGLIEDALFGEAYDPKREKTESIQSFVT
jgi:D-sedoheptulose 7-phosphate isomerase